MVLNKPIVGMAATPDGGGYWLVASDGGIFSYGDAAFYGSTGSMVLNKPVVGMAPTPDGKGYWLVASDGGIFSYGDAKFYGSTGQHARSTSRWSAWRPRPSGNGYWLVASDGGIFSYGDAQFHGSTGSLVLNKPIIGMITGPERGRLLPRRLRRRHLQLRHGTLLRLARRPAAQAPDRRGGGHPRRERLLVLRHRRTRLELRRGEVLRVGTLAAQPTHRGHVAGAGQRLLRRRDLPLGRVRLRHQHLPVLELPDRGPPDRHRAGGRELVGQHEPVPGPGGRRGPAAG